jgi:hypothetical protein
MLPPQPTDHRLPLSFVNSEDKLGNQLLARLENSQWKYCVECALLKPRKTFTSEEPTAPSPKRHCTRYDGIIEICPYLPLTRRDKKNLFHLLQSPITTPGLRYGCYGLKRDGEAPDGHLCSFLSNSGRKIEIYTKMSISTMGSLAFLNLEVWYFMRISAGDPFLAATPVFACPHLDLIPLVHTRGDYTRCYNCIAPVWREPRFARGADTVSFYVFRSLGTTDESVDLFWYGRCREPRNRSGVNKISMVVPVPTVENVC